VPPLSGRNTQRVRYLSIRPELPLAACGWAFSQIKSVGVLTGRAVRQNYQACGFD